MTRLQGLVLGKLHAEGLSIKSPWADIEKCLAQVVMPNLCTKAAREMVDEFASPETIADCLRCGGEGIIGHALEYGDPHDTTETCPVCGGSGEVIVDSDGNIVGPYKRTLLVTTKPIQAPF